MARFGWYLVLFGAGSALLSLFGREFVILGWIESWGSGAAWMIRGGMIALGAVLMLATWQQPAQTLPTSSQQGS
jgi:hypothetical protein